MTNKCVCSGWDYNENYQCWVWEVNTDDFCSPSKWLKVR